MFLEFAPAAWYTSSMARTAKREAKPCLITSDRELVGKLFSVLEREIRKRPLVIWSGEGDPPYLRNATAMSLVAGDGDLRSALETCFLRSEHGRR